MTQLGGMSLNHEFLLLYFSVLIASISVYKLFLLPLMWDMQGRFHIFNNVSH